MSDFLDLFKDSLETSGLEPNTALHHKNQLENIWGTIDSEMKMFPSNSYIDKFRDFYRAPIQFLEQSVNHFNNDLHPLIQQGKVEVREIKRRNLLTALHFINFGQSKFVQDLIKRYQSNKPVLFSTSFAVDFLNYLITCLVIGNGLRASNII